MADNSKLGKALDLGMSRQVFMKRVILILIIFVFLSVAIIFLSIYRPLKVELEKSLLDSFQELANIRYISLDNNINKGLEGARSMSSRSVIRDAILDYMDKEITLEELKKSTQERYEDGAKVLDNLLLAERYVEDKLISTYIMDDYKALSHQELGKIEKGSEAFYKIFLEEGQEYLKVVSPIYMGEKIIGYDLLLFGLREQIHKLCTEGINAEILSQEEMENIILNAKTLKKNETTSLLYSGEYFYKTFQLNDTNSLIVKQGEDYLLEPIHRTSSHVLLVTMGVLMFYSFGIYFFIIKYAKKELDNSSIDLGIARNEANTDPLTNLCSRRCGEDYLTCKFEEYKKDGNSPAVFLIDIDDLKKINDEHGHLVGDLTIQAISKKIKDSIRKEDKISRWGGDEFIGIFHGINKEDSFKLAQKLLREISSLEIFADKGIIKPTISIGVSWFSNEDYGYTEAVNRADKAMYKSKLEGKDNVNIFA